MGIRSAKGIGHLLTAVVHGRYGSEVRMNRRAFLRRGLVGAGAAACGLSVALPGCAADSSVSHAKSKPTSSSAVRSSGQWPWGTARTAEQTLTGYTSIQADGPYLSGWDWQTDVVLAYFDNATVDYEEQYKSWQGHGYRVGTMLAATLDWEGTYTRGLYDGKTHYALVQMDANGKYLEDSGAYWMAPIPSGEWLAYLQAMCKRAIDAGSRLIVFDEPMYAMAAGYEAPFKTAWQQAYGQAWQPQTASTQARWNTYQLKAQLWVKAFEQLGGWIHQYNPQTKVYPGPHSVLDFAYWGRIFPHAAVLELAEVDGLFYEVWGTFAQPTLQERTVLRWERAYAEYAMSGALSFQSNKGIKVMAQTNQPGSPLAGGISHQYPIGDMACALMIPWVESYHVGPAFRAGFTTPGPGLGHNRIMNMTRLYEGIATVQNLDGLDSGCDGLGVAVSDSLLCQDGNGFLDLQAWEGLFFPFSMQGLLPSCPSLEVLGRNGYLSGLGLRCLLLEYEDQVPGSDQVNAYLAAWVRQGGTLVVFGGHSPFNGVAGWWQQAGFSRPQDHLFAQLGIRVQGGTASAGRAWQMTGGHWAQGLAFNATLQGEPLSSVVGYGAVNGATALATAGGNVVAFEATYGKGNVFFFGCSPSYFSYSSAGAALAESIVGALYQRASLGTFQAQGHWGIDRGPVVMRRVSAGTVQLKGRYLRLSEGTMPLEVDPVAQAAPEPHVFLQVPWSTVNVPTLLFSNLRLSAVAAGHSQTVFTGASQQGAPGATRIWAPGRKLKGVTAGVGNGPLPKDSAPLWDASAIGLRSAWDQASESLLVEVLAQPAGVTVAVEWE